MWGGEFAGWQFADLKGPPPFPWFQVARFAMELLAEAGICVILSCSKELLAAVARCTGSEVALSVEQLTPRCVATCRAFRAEDPYRPLRLKSSRPPRMPATNRVVSFFAPPPPAPLPVDPDLGRPEMGLAIFEDCPLRLGSTILLQVCALPVLSARPQSFESSTLMSSKSVRLVDSLQECCSILSPSFQGACDVMTDDMPLRFGPRLLHRVARMRS